MEEQKGIEICKTCQKRRLHKDLGLLCGITHEKPNPEQTHCGDYFPDHTAIQRVKQLQEELKNKKTEENIFLTISSFSIFFTLAALLVYWVMNTKYENWLIPLILFITLETIRYIWISYRKLTPQKLTKLICKYLYDNGFSYEIDNGHINFHEKAMSYVIDVYNYENSCFIEIFCSLKVEHDEEKIVKLYCLDVINRTHNLIKAEAVHEGVIISSFSRIENSKMFRQLFPFQLRAIHTAYSHFLETYEEAYDSFMSECD